MKKTLTFVAALICAATMAKAETPELSQEAMQTEATQMNTDAEFLEEKSPLMAAPAADAQKDSKYWAEAVGSRVKVMAYAQGGYTAQFNEANSSANTNTFDMKRVILMVGVDVAKDFYAFFMHDFKGGSMHEYYLEYRPSKALNFRFGQSKIELSMENPMSPTILESIGPMSQSVGYLCGGYKGNGAGRDNGIMVYGDVFNNKLRYVVEMLNGSKINTADDNSQKDIIAKLEYKPVPNFRVSLSGMKGYYSTIWKADGTAEKFDRKRADRYAFGAEWKSKITGSDYYKNRCVTVRAEALGGRDGQTHSFGAYCSAAIPLYKQLDAVAMADYFNKNTEAGAKQTNLMAGLQYWIHKKCRLQAQYQYSLKSDAMKSAAFTNSGNYSQILTQVQVAF